MIKRTNKGCKRMIRKHSGSERIINGCLHFGINLYAWADELQEANIPIEHVIKAPNPLFRYLTLEGADAFIDYLEKRDGLLYESQP